MKLVQRIYKPGRRGPGEALWLVYDKIVAHQSYYLKAVFEEMASGCRPKETAKLAQLPNVDVTAGEFRYCKSFLKKRSSSSIDALIKRLTVKHVKSRG